MARIVLIKTPVSLKKARIVLIKTPVSLNIFNNTSLKTIPISC